MSHTVPSIVLPLLKFGGLLGALYLARLDRKQKSSPPDERRAIAASRRRAQGHLWMLGVIFATMLILGLCVGTNRPPVSPQLVAELALLAIADVFFGLKAVSAYRDARATPEKPALSAEPQAEEISR